MKIKKACFLRIFQLVLICLFFYTPLIQSQQMNLCGTDIVVEGLAQELQGYTSGFEQFKQNCNQNQGLNNDEYIIPIVVHVIHNNGQENISDTQIFDAISQTNEQLSTAVDGIGDSKIQLRLASLDPLGHCSSGIVRIQHNDPTITLTGNPPIDYFNDVNLKNLSRWNVDNYLNIWIIKSINNDLTQGYAYLPPLVAGGELVDGIVIGHKFFGRIETADGNNISTLTHELGHYLSLCHVWRCPSTFSCHLPEDCETQGDKVCDTEQCFEELFTSDCSPEDNDCPDDAPSDYYPKENYMSYAATCHDRFTSKQVEHMYFTLEDYRSNLISPTNLVCTGVEGFFGANINIDNNTIWTPNNLPNNGEIVIHGNLTITSGNELTIQSGVKVHFCKDSKLIIEPDAELDLSGSLTSHCNGSWKGIEVWGNSNASQYTISGVNGQGILRGRTGSVIENADIGVQLWGLDKTMDAGGRVSCFETRFINNRIAVWFAPYTNFWPFSTPPFWTNDERNYFGNFTKCTFEINTEYNNSDSFYSFLRLEGVNGVRIAGCDFFNSQNLVSPSEIQDYGYAIFASDAGFDVVPACNGNTYPCTEYKNSEFNGLGYAICAENIIANRPHAVKQAIFNNCYFGIHNKGVSYSTYLSNEFNLGNLPDPSINSGEQIGTFFENAIAGFILEENKFTQVAGNASITTGTLCKSLGVSDNLVKNNRYIGLTNGNVANGINGVALTPSPGLFYECNENIGITEFDFSVPDGPGSDRIKWNHGIPIPNTQPIQWIATGNKFSYSGSPSGSDFYSPVFLVRYYYNPQGTNETPMNYDNIDPRDTQFENTCASDYCEPPCMTEEEIDDIKSTFYGHKGNYKIETLAYMNAINSGNQIQIEAKSGAVDYHRREMSKNAQLVILHTLYDTLSFSNDTLRNWLINMDTYEAELMLARNYLAKGENTEALSVLQNVPNKFELLSEQISDLAQLQNIFYLLSQESVYNLSELAKSDLVSIANLKLSYSSSLAENILSLYDEYFPPVYYLPNGVNNRSDNSAAKAPNAKADQFVLVYPNPTTDYITFEIQPIDKPFGEIVIVNSIGEQMWRKSIGESTKSISWNVNNIPEGIYYYNYISRKASIQSGKIIVTK